MSKFFNKNHSITKENAKEIFSLVEKGDNVSLVCLPRTFRTEFGASLQTQSGLSDYLSKEQIENTEFIYIDLTLEKDLIEEQLGQSLRLYSNKENITSKLKDITFRKSLVIVVDNANFNDTNILKYILNLKLNNNEKINFIFLFIESDFINDSNINDLGLIFFNVIKSPYFTKELAISWLKENDSSISDETAETIYNFCGGTPALLKAVIRLRNKYDSLDKVFESLEINKVISHLWSRFIPEEQVILLGNKGDERITNYLKELNAIDESGKVLVTGLI
ncbi:MAG: hypothetical protein Q9M91_03280 [Candidatus Dojkabacteria bacterium]|nr:hypothetical protein [Candidatus Dojkabacteria bacterium]MDQ7020846.1 hypothetical protein [Candidatus Dojkabacteria bacterium]